jgi:hypothetical protein
MNSSVTLPPSPPSLPPVEQGLQTAEAECTVFTRYLTGRLPADYVLKKYRAGHETIPYRRLGEEDAFDILLVVVARGGTIRARIADAYARVMRPYGVLRQKLTLLLAVLENAPDHHRDFTSGGRGIFSAVLGIGWSLLSFALSFTAGFVILGPLHAMLRGRKRPALTQT